MTVDEEITEALNRAIKALSDAKAAYEASNAKINELQSTIAALKILQDQRAGDRATREFRRMDG
jgi:uncharacterized Zn finger protein (UPF0148 family)